MLLSWTGSWLGGQSNSDRLLLVIAYAQIPIVFTIAIFIIQLILFRTTEFSSEEILSLKLNEMLVLISLISLELILSIWSLILMVVGISVAQNFTIVKAVSNLILATLMLILPILIILVLFSAF